MKLVVIIPDDSGFLVIEQNTTLVDLVEYTTSATLMTALDLAKEGYVGEIRVRCVEKKKEVLDEISEIIKSMLGVDYVVQDACAVHVYTKETGDPVLAYSVRIPSSKQKREHESVSSKFSGCCRNGFLRGKEILENG